jgi:hypothetical protein
MAKMNDDMAQTDMEADRALEMTVTVMSMLNIRSPTFATSSCF